MPKVEERTPAPPPGLGGGGNGGKEGFPLLHVGLFVLLLATTSPFAALASAYLVRMGLPDWRPLPKPPLLWLNTLLLLLASLALERGARLWEGGVPKQGQPWVWVGGALGASFLVGQLFAWHLLLRAGYAPASNPASAFFYLVTGLHGLHLLGGGVALAWALARGGQTLRPCA
ncbi:cytochrome c oxidase subunit 3 family protein [Thermus sediminis]|uniref:cytochrome c oxidase subunit 3 n=1 Tax=Thermus sediminis TaxID=1761908 RepID=UPI000E3C704E|nr:cytochrome c oxidase subunit 3 [Thermus sediminis]